MLKDVIIACDFPNKHQTLGFLDLFKGRGLFLKIGMELFYGCGSDFVREIKDLGHKIFLDLKLCDIPNTVYGAVKSLAVLGADMLSIHAFGGSRMISAASEAANGGLKILAVTILTSISEEVFANEILNVKNCKEIKKLPSIDEAVLNYSKIAKENGANGVVCSPHEVCSIKNSCGKDFLTVTPGIRYESSRDDQARTSTPAEAKKFGSDFIVVGRPITRAEDPCAEYEKILNIFLA
ncbi:MAG: orotidine-5'-phosphate decarboxylase [Oscillospiraceae bacterium]|nr:orotidine-5'-phosphate decarboxylase [Oscillospiraceae bacterium]